MFPPIVAIEVDTILGFVFVVVWVIAWLFKLATGQTQKGPPVPNRPRPPARPRDENLQDEIDIFIQEVGPKKATRRPPAATGRPPATAKPGTAGPKPQPQPAKTSAPATRPAPRRVRPGEEISSRRMPDTEQSMGAGVKQHLSQHMAERVSKEAAAYLQPKVEQSVTEHLGRSTTAGVAQLTVPAPATAVSRNAMHSGGGFTELFQNPTSLRQAMVISLILSPPPGRKPRPTR